MNDVPYIMQWRCLYGRQLFFLLSLLFCFEAAVAKEPLPLVLLENNLAYKNTTNSIVASYYPEWGIYERNFPVAKIPASNLTHIFYGFIAICGPNEALRQAYEPGWQVLQKECEDQADYTVTIYDRWAAIDKAFEGDQDSDPIKGNFGQLMRLKLAKPDIKIMPSFGGWTLSDPFYTLANNATHRQTFINSVIAFLKNYPLFDGVDIDWEYPGGGGANSELGSSADYEAYADLMRDLRQAINGLEQETGRSYLLTSAVGVAPDKINAVNYTRAVQYLDYVFAMGYDFYGAWNGELGHHAALHTSDHQKLVGFDGASGITNLINAGIPANKLVLGVAKYGRGWINITGVNSGESPFINGVSDGTAHPGTWESGNLDYRDIANNYLSSHEQGKNGYSYFYDEQAEAPYLWNASTGRLITYDNKRSAKAKAQYARNNNLAGVFSWEIDADNGDILNSMHEGLGHPLSSDTQSVKRPFPQHVSYASNTIRPNNFSQSEQDQHVRSFYDYWKQNYIVTASNSSYRVAFAKGSDATVSEGQGFGMIITAIMAGHDSDAQVLFDGLWKFSRQFPSGNDNRLMSWKIQNGQVVDGNSSAFDGDADIAYGLVLADAQWGSSGDVNYKAEAITVIEAILASTIGPNSRLPMLGDWVQANGAKHNEYTPRSSDFMPAHFRAFGNITNDSVWNTIISNSQAVIDTIQNNHSSTTGLLPDFIMNCNNVSQCTPANSGFLEGNHDGHYYYNAGRDPWRIALDGLLNNDSKSHSQAQKMISWLANATGGNVNQIKAGYQLDGTGIGNYLTTFFVAPFGVAAMLDPNKQAFLNDIYAKVYNKQENYYEDSVNLFSLLVMTGNFWDSESNSTPPVAAGSLQFSQATYSVNEGTGSTTITVSRTGGSDGSVSVDYAINDGTASSGTDYSATPGTLTFHDGDSSNKLITVNIIDDNNQESSENFSLVLSNATGGAAIGNTNTTTVTIIDNDSANNCLHATFSVADQKISIPMLDMPLLDSMTGEPNGNIAVLQADLGMTEGVGDFKMIPESVAVIAGAEPNAECHASYSYNTRIMHLPFVDVASTIMLPPNIVIDGPVQVFDANLQQLQLYNEIFHLKDYTYLYELK